ncbi:(2Fe-2S)-binding protein [Mangrovicella endophytica]|uniref:(2Fe-2S)-binding protein n=1 Tax=Mangrovicella endophytica TaxID=2066697 RepID=UPI000C9E0807|nr:(2Fe-2S)-binding protein [Mangrovicella endophytica]
MFRRLREAAPALRFRFDGEPLTGVPGDTIAAALLASGRLALRKSVVGGEPRAPYCMMGVCFECLVEVDGVANRQACLTPLTDGMEVRSQSGARTIRPAAGQEP